MKHAFWSEKWTANQLGFHQSEINAHLIESASSLGRGGRVFVPLCGKSKDMLYLARELGFQVVGVEFVEQAVQDFFAENNITFEVEEVSAGVARYTSEKIELWHADIFKLSESELGTFGHVYDRAALIALPPVIRKKYVAKIDSLANSGAQQLLISLDYDPGEMNGPPFGISTELLIELYSASWHIDEVASFDILEQEPRFKKRGLSALNERVYAMTKK